MSNLHAGDIKPTSDDYLDKFIDLRAQVFEYLNFDFGVDKEYINGEPNKIYWKYKDIREKVEDAMSDMLMSIIQARTIWITNLYEYNERRRYITRAIADCEYAIQEFQFAIRMKWVKPGKYENLIDLFTVQIQSLRNWKSSDNRLKERLKP